MSATIKQRFIHMSPRKLRLVADAVRGKSTDEAVMKLTVMPKIAAMPIQHAVKSAVSAAKKTSDGPFIISAIYIDEGPALKRRIIRSRGRASRMEHRMSHITVTIDAVPTKESGKGKEK